MENRISKLVEMFPECVIESRDHNGNLKHSIDFDVLRQILGDQISDDPEAYRFDWVGKNSARIDAYRKIDKTLRPDLDSSLNFDSTENLYIEGDNLDVLKLLQQSYFKKIKLIYIDPPYNTGHDFIYKDRFEMDSEEYSEAIDLFDENGNRKFVENSDSNPRFHSDWCSMIYSRLLLARNLLSDDGVIFISIDDNEQSNLKKICDEVFGERNFVANLLWTKTNTPPSLSIKTRKIVEYVLVYEKRLNKIKYYGAPIDGEDMPLLNEGNPIKTLSFPAGSIKFKFIDNGVISADEKEKVTLLDNLEIKNGVNINPIRMTGHFKWSQETLENEIQNGTYFIVKSEKFSIRFQRINKEESYKTPTNLLPVELNKSLGIGTNETAVKDLSGLGLGNCFDYSKPFSLIKFLIEMICKNDPDAIVLDFFSGSATTAHAVMQLNSEDHGSRKFIMVQLPEICPENSETFKSGFKNICEIGKERIRRAGSNFENIDRGFRVLKLDSTNFRDVSISPEELTREKLFDLIENIKSDRSPLDLLFECLIDWGIELNLKLEIEEFEGSTILNYNSGDLIACFDKNISKSVIEFMASKNPNRVVFRDESFSSDSDRINSREIFKLHSPNTRFKVI
ncbi:MAG: site-specific DNA-methyltransferase [Selenomonadaceae bacterium]|nr:site-specific DNA-methyltransferase [Selenomonadaceae bacterium]